MRDIEDLEESERGVVVRVLEELKALKYSFKLFRSGNSSSLWIGRPGGEETWVSVRTPKGFEYLLRVGV